jgi:prepilin-type N-terminal cleavage/methylation domain-containing protein
MANKNHQKGLSLIEVIISMAIFAIGFLAIASLVIATTRNNTTGNILTEATMLARDKIEFLKALPVDQLEAACRDEIGSENIHSIFARDCEVNALGSSTTIKTIKVSVKWKKAGQLRQIVLETNTRGRGK